MDKTKQNIEADLAKEVSSLSKEIKKLKGQDFMQIFSHPWKFVWYSFVKGLMVGFGTVLGATILVAIFIYVLANIQLVPILGDFIQSILSEIQINPEDIKNVKL